MGLLRWLRKRSNRRYQGKPLPTILIVGSPNVGKSVLFHRLTGRYVTVSNYPGTTVEVSKGIMAMNGKKIRVLDSPGMYSLNPITEEERVARQILINDRPDLVLHVVDAKNLERMLPLTLELKEGGLHLILVLNMMDELEKNGLSVDVERLQQTLNLPVVPTVCLNERGIAALKEQIYVSLNSPAITSPHS